MEIVDPRIEAYTERARRRTTRCSPNCRRATTRELGQSAMLTGPVAGRFLELLVWIAQPHRVLEIGTFSGHSALAMAAGLPEGGHIDACEVVPERAAFAQGWFDRSPYGSKITLHVGPAAETIASLEGEFDFVFIDADKGGYTSTTTRRCAAALTARSDRRRQHAGGRPRGRGRPRPPIASFNEHVAADPRTVQVLLSVRDGMTLIRLA